MRLSCTVLLAAIGAGFSANAQLLNVKDANDMVVNGTTVHFEGAPTDEFMELGLICSINGAQEKAVRLKRYEMPSVMGTKNYFCWDLCWLPANAGLHPVWYSNGWVDLAPGEDYGGFKAYHMPEGMDTTACFRYVWYDDANENDSVWVDICFSTTGAGVHDVMIADADMRISPNPTNGVVPTVWFSGNGSNAQGLVVLRSVTGSTMMIQAKKAGQHAVTLEGEELPEGVYFASLEQDGRRLATRQVVITR